MGALARQAGGPEVAPGSTGGGGAGKSAGAIARARPARPLGRQCRAPLPAPRRHHGALVAAAEGRAEVAGPARAHRRPRRRRRLVRQVPRRGARARPRREPAAVRGSRDAVPELRIHVVVLEGGVREPCGGLLPGEPAGALAPVVGGGGGGGVRRRRSLGVRDDAPVVPEQLDEVGGVHAADAIGRDAQISNEGSIDARNKKEGRIPSRLVS